MNINYISRTPQKKETISATNLFVFNPEHDLALAVGDRQFTPPKEALLLRKEKSLLPALYASNGDFILVVDYPDLNEIPSLPFYDVCQRKNLGIVTLSGLHAVSSKVSEIIPWGWDFAVYKLLCNNGVGAEMLPETSTLENIRRLSHRRTTIRFRETIAKELGEDVKNPARELFSWDDVSSFLEEFPVAYFKAPWSSSGHGVVVSDHISSKGLKEWTAGTLRRQGSILAEPAWNRCLDFATEWIVKDGTPLFLGYSVFETSSRGKYHGNMNDSQENLLKVIKKNAPRFDERIIAAQYAAIAGCISPYYSGPLGIDMLADTAGNINCCVELNLRMTMGHIPILQT